LNCHGASGKGDVDVVDQTWLRERVGIGIGFGEVSRRKGPPGYAPTSASLDQLRILS